MTDRVNSGIRTGLQQLYRFLLTLLQGQNDRSCRNPAADSRAWAAKQVRDGMHTTMGNSGFSFCGASEVVLGRILRDGHK